MTACTVEMPELRGAPFYLVAGSSIVIRVSAANGNSFGPLSSELDNGQKVADSPPPMYQPTVTENRAGQTVVVSWEALAPASGPISSYELYNYSQIIYSGLDTSTVVDVQ